MTGCIIWDGPIHSKGYGVAGRRRAHRVVWQEINEQPVPDGMVVHHTCGIKACVNPEHLVLMTPREHLRLHDPGNTSGRRELTHCFRGHALTSENARVYAGNRHCRACATIRMREYRARAAS